MTNQQTHKELECINYTIDHYFILCNITKLSFFKSSLFLKRGKIVTINKKQNTEQ